MLCAWYSQMWLCMCSPLQHSTHPLRLEHVTRFFRSEMVKCTTQLMGSTNERINVCVEKPTIEMKTANDEEWKNCLAIWNWINVQRFIITIERFGTLMVLVLFGIWFVTVEQNDFQAIISIAYSRSFINLYSSICTGPKIESCKIALRLKF